MIYRKLTEIKELPNNPRLIKDKQFETLCTSIKDNPEYFEARPIILSNRTGELIIIAGNQRYRAAKHLKLKQVPTYLLENLTEEKEREIIIRDNVSNGEWDYDILANSFETDDLIEWGLDLPVWGDSDEINDINEIDSFNENVNFIIKCKDLKEMELLQSKLGTEGMKIDYDKFIELTGL